MAKIKPTSAAVRRQYRDKLPGPKQRGAFDQLARLIDDPRADLVWHYQVGTLVRQLRPEDRRGTQWSRKLAEGLGPSRELLEKALRFAELYPSEKSVRKLENMNVNWSSLYRVFMVRDENERHALLRRAASERWNDQELRQTIQREYPSKRKGLGGRPRRSITCHGPEVALCAMGRLSRIWTASYEGYWSELAEKDWKQLEPSWPATEREKLRNLLSDTARDVQVVAIACAQVRRHLADLIKEMRKTERKADG